VELKGTLVSSVSSRNTTVADRPMLRIARLVGSREGRKRME